MMSVARIFITLGLVLLVIGGIIYLLNLTGFRLGHLPGDIRIERENLTCVIPLATSILVSILLTLILNLVVRLLNR